MFQMSCTFDYLTRTPANIAYNYFLVVFGFLLPVVVLAYCNIHLVRALRESNRMRHRYHVTFARVAPPGSSRVTRTLVAIVCVYILSISPGELLQFYYYTMSPETVEWFAVATEGVNALQSANFSFNFVLYCSVNVHFRNTCKELVCCSAIRRRGARSRSRVRGDRIRETPEGRRDIGYLSPRFHEEIGAGRPARNSFARLAN